ncbi:hypothetical protein GGI19_002652 [Coemansia pectinata]|uniref:F-box domain-containing protein n=1 Tax=Coemansia pectinata TaxID=1052879 RepID=A0A9W8GVH1_9FUNG|nr:hypothetical protein GGI19_002652 [Coemansia pectinata]
MPHINDLPAAVLAQILSKAVATPVKHLSEWKAKLPLLAVCRKWTELVQGLVFNQVYVELPELPDSILSAHLLWTSNAELFITRGCVLKAQRLKIELSYDVTSDHLRLIALDILKLDRVDWQRINSLTFTLDTWILSRPFELVSPDELAAADVARTVQYFAQNLRNIAELDLCSLASESAGEYLYSNLATLYGQKLQVLRTEGTNPLPFSCIPRKIKVLELTLDSSAVRVLPSICGETLKVLKLDEVPRNFAWHHFRYDDLFGSPIVFCQLAVLHLTFEHEDIDLTEVEIQDKIVSGAHCCDQLCFPALRELIIRNCTPDCDLLYADFPLPKLETVKLSGTAKSILHCSRLKLTWVRDLAVFIYPSDSGDVADIYKATNHLFIDISIGRTASLIATVDWFIMDPELVRWVNLTKLEVRDVDYAAVCKAIGRLPNLRELIVYRLVFDITHSDSFIIDLSLFTSADPMLTWGEKLAMLAIHEVSRDYPVAAYIGGIHTFILHTGRLEKLSMPQSTIQLVGSFIDMYKDYHPHLANIQLL